MKQILIVDAAHENEARRLFPSVAVQSATLPEVDADTDAILWCHNATIVAEDFCRSAAQVRIVSDAKMPPSFNGRGDIARHYVRNAMVPWKAPETPQKVNGHDPGAEQPPEAREPVAPAGKPSATVTPITEARTRQQEKPKELPEHDYTPLAEDALARAFTAAHPELRYVAPWKQWLEWTPGGWQEDTTLHVFDLARQLCVEQAMAHVGQATPAAIVKAKSAGTRAAVENLARADRVHAASVAQWDHDLYGLNTPGGYVDLRTGNIRPVRLDDYCLKMAAATPAGESSVWLDFLKYGTDGDTELIGFLQRWAGLCATGDTREQKFVFMHGRGGSGKGTFLNTVTRVLGSYAKSIAMETLTESNIDRHPEEIARLAGVRMVTASETQQGKRWNEARLKMLTGEDTVTARQLYQSSFDFKPQLKLTIMGNHPPGLRSVDASMKRRLLIAPFDHIPPVPDTALPEKLWAERAGIMAWIVYGALEWQCDGLKPPESVIKASGDYFDNQDITGQWIGECCETGERLESTIRTLYASYRDYVEPTGYQPLRQGELRDALLMRGYTRGGYKSAPTIKGLRVREKSDPASNGAARGYVD